MGGLLGLLDLGASGLLAGNAGVAVAGRNIANINTEGYSRESVDLESERAAPLVGGVRSGSPTRAQSPLLAGRERRSAGALGQAEATAEGLSGLEQALVAPGADVSSALSSFFGAASALAAAPLDESLRQALVAQAQALADTLRAASEAVAASQAEANARILSYTEEANRLAERIAETNKTLAQGNDPVVADQRDLAARKLAELTGGDARIDADGMMRFVTGGGAVLVDGVRAAKLAVVPDPAAADKPRVVIQDGAHSVDVTATLDGGRIAGELAFRDGAAAQAGTDLDQLAFDLVAGVNAVHAAGTGLDGGSGRPLFVVPTAAAGAAAAMAVDPTIAADPRLVGAAGAGEGNGGGSNMLKLSGLASTLGAAAGTRSFIEEGIRIIGSVGGAAARAEGARSLETARAASLASLRDSLSGVSQDEELARLSAFQHSTEAATKLVGVVNDLLDRLMNM